jgi:ribosomal protein S18 acetylase RimI-like enzyme
MQILPFESDQLEAVVELSLRAWAPVFESIAATLDDDVYDEFYPAGWHASQRDAIESVCRDPRTHVWVAIEETRVAAFVALRIDVESRLGEIYMIAVDPDFQRRGVATALTDHSLDWFRKAGMRVAMVETGGDPGHAPARAAYESAGFRKFPLARYFRKV